MYHVRMLLLYKTLIRPLKKTPLNIHLLNMTFIQEELISKFQR